MKIEYKGKAVLTNAQIAESFELAIERVRDCFKRNRKRFVEGEDYFKVMGAELAALKERMPALLSPLVSAVTLYTESGTGIHARLLNRLEVFATLQRDYFGTAPAVTPFVGKLAYIDKNEVAWFNAEWVARQLGFVEEGKFSIRGENYVRWERVNGYLREFGYDKQVGKGDYLPENMVYRLAMKANNESAVKFQMKIANEILPSIRKTGSYSVKQAAPVEKTENNEEVNRLRKQLTREERLELAVVYVLLMSNGTVKIGFTGNLPERIQKLKAETGLYVLDYKTTPFMSREEARRLEAALKERFADCCMGGEFFDVKFTHVAGLLN